MWTFERFLRVMYAQVTFEVSFSSELFAADVTFKQHLSWHMYHLHVHL